MKAQSPSGTVRPKVSGRDPELSWDRHPCTGTSPVSLWWCLTQTRCGHLPKAAARRFCSESNGPPPLPPQSTVLLDITTTPAPTAASAARQEPTSLSLDRTTASPVQETPPQTLMEPPMSPTAKVTPPPHP